MKHLLSVALFLILAVLSLPAREVRAVWLTTNSGLDWPGNVYDEKGQKKLLRDMLDRLQRAHFNMILFQVQANGDVAWDSSFQPAMVALTGDGSKSLGYDLCRFVIDECHKRDMECHAWVVPFRLGSPANSAKYASNKVKHPVRSKSGLCVKFNGSYYLDPGNPATREYLLALYRELVEKYDFDGINLDYTRYPGKAFPDRASFRKYNPGKLNKDYGNSTAFDTFQQDPVQWIESGHHDLIIPQMYWDEKFGFSDHLDTWVNFASGKNIIVGLAPYKMLEGGWSSDIVVSQIEKALSRKEVSGVCFFRARHLLGDEPEVKALYRYLVKHKPKGGKSHKHNKVESVEKFLE